MSYFIIFIGVVVAAYFKIKEENKEQIVPLDDIIVPAQKNYTKDEVLGMIEVVNEYDDFEDTSSVYFNNVSIDNYKYIPFYTEKIGDFVCHNHIGISFSIFNGNIFLDVYSFDISEMGLAKGDEIKFIFDNNEKLFLTFTNARINNGYTKNNHILLSPEELNLFCENKIDKWKLISSRRNVYTVGDNSFFHKECMVQNKELCQEVVQYLASKIRILFLNTRNLNIN
ncbi:hypothetical protein T190611E02C_40292 [Tenacibaculum sp. 190524A05c]|uniref:hypothetical protein n=1 Tax=Tenacibaculum platacis TaxID=3137852 RepID=UPI0031FB1C37